MKISAKQWDRAYGDFVEYVARYVPQGGAVICVHDPKYGHSRYEVDVCKWDGTRLVTVSANTRNALNRQFVAVLALAFHDKGCASGKELTLRFEDLEDYDKRIRRKNKSDYDGYDTIQYLERTGQGSWNRIIGDTLGVTLSVDRRGKRICIKLVRPFLLAKFSSPLSNPEQ